MEKKTSIRDRVSQVTWGWFSISMATGGIAVLLYNTPHRFAGLETIGKIVYIFNLVLFKAISLCLAIRFVSRRAALKGSFQHPNETHFIATCPLALATIILGASTYGTPACGPWLITALRVVFWIYVALSTLQAILHNWYLYHLHLASKQPFAIPRLLPSFPAMLSGTIASVLASHQPAHHAVPILVAGITLQGFGFVMSLFIYAEYFYRLNKDGLPAATERPELFIAVGPWSFTALAVIGMAEGAVQKVPVDWLISSSSPESLSSIAPTAAQVSLILASLVAIFLWFLAFYSLCIAILSMFSLCRVFGGQGVPPMSLPWWSMVFPNTGFVIATIRIGTVLQSEAVLWVASAMTILQVAVWLAVLAATGWLDYNTVLFLTALEMVLES
ncbi:voltage-dependent anion channel [Aspergillus pseudoustus]|uniref:Voltage-dependent anion channel n=1 Tax=Aspergillus pseudoustus TaxID=1810923 RepID=A0ABR4KAF7_9EURO